MEASQLNAQLSQLEDMWKSESVKVWTMQQDISPEKELGLVDPDMTGARLAKELLKTKPVRQRQPKVADERFFLG